MKENIVVIGGGAIGLSIAYYLKNMNQEVTLLDKGSFGEGSSNGNMGWICPLLTQPVPAPGLTSTSIKWMLKKDSPLYIRPSSIPKMSKWLFHFWKNCNTKNFNKGKKILMDLQRDSIKYFDELLSEGLNFEYHKDGFVFIFKNERNLHSKYNELKEKAKEMDYDEPVLLSYQEIRSYVPGLSDAVLGGIFLPDQAHLRPESLWNAMSSKLNELGVSMKPNTKVEGFQSDGHTITGVETQKGIINGDKFVFATGAWSGPILKELGYRIPVEAGKGYSVTMNQSGGNFKYPMYLGDSSAAITPFDNGVRVGGTMELSGINTKLDERRINGIRNEVSGYFETPLNNESEIKWTGMRPMTPDGLPIMDKMPKHSNTYIATGHAMEGIVLALKTGKIMAELITNGQSTYDISDFSLERFS